MKAKGKKGTKGTGPTMKRPASYPFVNDDPDMKDDFKRLKNDFLANGLSKNTMHARIYSRAWTVASHLGYSEKDAIAFRTDMCRRSSKLHDDLSK